MPVTAAEVDELRREGHAMLAAGRMQGEHHLETLAEIIGFVILQWKQAGVDQDELLHDLELLIRSTDQSQQDIREARDVLKALGYDVAVIRLLTALARRAKPDLPWWAARGQRQADAALWPSNEAALSLARLRRMPSARR